MDFHTKKRSKKAIVDYSVRGTPNSYQELSVSQVTSWTKTIQTLFFLTLIEFLTQSRGSLSEIIIQNVVFISSNDDDLNFCYLFRFIKTLQALMLVFRQFTWYPFLVSFYLLVWRK